MIMGLMPDPPHQNSGNGDVEALMDKAREMPVAQPVAEPPKAHKIKGHLGNIEPYVVACPECSAPMLWPSLRNHRERKHGVPRGFSYNQRYLRSLQIDAHFSEPEPGGRRKVAKSNSGRPGTYKPPKRSDTPVSQPAAPKPKRSEPLDAQALIDAVLTSLFPKNIPVAKIKAVTRWVAATEQFVEEAEL